MPQSVIPSLTVAALKQWNKDNNNSWSLGTNWSNVSTQFETFINKYLFPKIQETTIAQQDLGNRFDFLAKEIDFIGQYSEEYVILDSIPVDMDLSQDEILMLKRNYPKMATKLYGQGIVKKQKFTINNNDARLNWSTLADGISYAMAVYRKKVSDINVDEESTIKAMLVDYGINHAKEQRKVTSIESLSDGLGLAILNLQNNSAKYNEATEASGGSKGRYTTYTALKDVFILTTDVVKAYILKTDLATTFQVKGLDLTEHIISFEDLGGIYRLTDDVTISDDATLEAFKNMGDYQIKMGAIIPASTVIPWDVSNFADFKGHVEEITPGTDLWAGVFDINAMRYRRYTKGMIKPPFYNGEFDESTTWLHYYTFKSVSPFYNKIILSVE